MNTFMAAPIKFEAVNSLAGGLMTIKYYFGNLENPLSLKNMKLVLKSYEEFITKQGEKFSSAISYSIIEYRAQIIQISRTWAPLRVLKLNSSSIDKFGDNQK